MSTTLPNIGLVVPVSGDTDYPTSISTSLTNLDNHDHTTGKGIPIATAAIDNLAVTTAKIDALAVTTAKIAALNVTRAKLEAVGQQVSASCGTFSTNSGTPVDVTNLSVTITTTGRPVVIGLMQDGGALGSTLTARQTGAYPDLGASALFSILRGATLIASHYVSCNNRNVGQENAGISVPSSSIHMLDVVAAGTYTYKLQASYGSSTVTSDLYADVNFAKLFAYEL